MIPPAGDASPQPDNVQAGCAVNAPFMSSIALIFQRFLRQPRPILEANAKAGGVTSRQSQGDPARPHF
jgi:hypothetical protein